jgi:hypothetical protein
MDTCLEPPVHEYARDDARLNPWPENYACLEPPGHDDSRDDARLNPCLENYLCANIKRGSECDHSKSISSIPMFFAVAGRVEDFHVIRPHYARTANRTERMNTRISITELSLL